MKRWTILALANKPYLPYIRRLAETLKKSNTNAYTCFSLVNCSKSIKLPVDEIIHEEIAPEKEVYYCIWGKPRTLRRMIDRKTFDNAVWIDADSIVWKCLDPALEWLEKYEMCSKQKVSDEKMLTGMISMDCSWKMRKFCNEWEYETDVFASKTRKPWSSSQRTMNTVMWPKWKHKVRFGRIPGKIFDVKWRKGSYVWTACGVDDRKKSDKVWKNIK